MYLAALIVAFLTNSRGGMQIETSHSPEAVTLAPGAPPGQIVRRPCHRFAAQNGTDFTITEAELDILEPQVSIELLPKKCTDPFILPVRQGKRYLPGSG